MRKMATAALVLVLSLGVLGGCNSTSGNDNGNASNNTNNSTDNTSTVNSADPISSRTPAETVLLYADLCTARDLQGMTEILYGFNDMSWNFGDDDEETFVETIIVVQNPSAQMEPEEIEFYQSQFPDLLNTAIVCAQETCNYRVHATGEPNSYVQYLDYYLVSTKDHPDWRIVAYIEQAG